MAAGGNLEYYLNREVSVITTREIRYQGELSSFDKGNRTITLRNVHNMGTEDRVSPMRVFPSAKTFDFIVFYAEHLKDFRPTPSDSEDPAIVSCVAERFNKPSQNVMSMLERPSPMHSNNSRSHGGRVRVIDIHQMLNHQSDHRRSHHQQSSKNQRRNPHNDQQGRGKQGNRRVSFKDAEMLVGSRERGSSSFTHIPHIPRNMVVRFVKAKKGGGGGGAGGAGGHAGDSHSKGSKTSRVTQGRFEADKGAKMKFDEDYDFQKAFEDFANLSVSDKATETGGEADKAKEKDKDGEAKEYYNKDLFFDNLTTTNADAVRRTRKDELEGNKVTFGVAQVRREKWRRPSSFRMGMSNGRRRGTSRVMA